MGFSRSSRLVSQPLSHGRDRGEKVLHRKSDGMLTDDWVTRTRAIGKKWIPAKWLDLTGIRVVTQFVGEEGSTSRDRLTGYGTGPCGVRHWPPSLRRPAAAVAAERPAWGAASASGSFPGPWHRERK